MSDSDTPQSPSQTESEETFAEALSRFEASRARRPEDGKRLQGKVIAVSGDSVLLDIGFKTEGILPLAVFESAGETVKPGDTVEISVKGRNPEGYYELSRFQVERPTDWPSLERAFAEKATVLGKVTGVVKGGLTVDVGVRAFLPASRSGARNAAEMGKLVGEEVRCRITKLDVTTEDVVVDRRVVAEEEERSLQQRRYAEIQEGDIVQGVVRSLTDYGAFIDLGGVDGLLHVSDLAWTRISSPADVLSVGQQLEAKVLNVDPGQHRISLGLKQLQAHPWESVTEKYKVGERIQGRVTRVVDFGAFVELEPGIEGLIHVSEMSWGKRIRNASEVLKPGDRVEAVILAVDAGSRRISLGLKQALGDPWADAAVKFPVGTVVEGTVTSLTKFGAFVQLAENVEGMIHISDITQERRLNHPQEALKVNQAIKAQVLEIDPIRRRLRLGIKQMAPSGLEEYIAEHKPGDIVTGRILEVSGGYAQVELGEGIHAACPLSRKAPPREQPQREAKADLSSLTSMLKARWKGGAPASDPGAEVLRAGQIRSFRIAELSAEAKTIELSLVDLA